MNWFFLFFKKSDGFRERMIPDFAYNGLDWYVYRKIPVLVWRTGIA